MAADAELDSTDDLLERHTIDEDDDDPIDIFTKIVAAKVSPCVVGVSTRGSPDDVFVVKNKFKIVEDVFSSSGTIIECEDMGDGRYFSTILASANLFKHKGLQPNQVKVHVYTSDKKYVGKLLDCDFHYNLAAIRIQSDSPLQAAKFRGLDDVFPIDPTQQRNLYEGKPFLRPHSKLFKILPGTKVVCLGLSCTPERSLLVASGVCYMRISSGLDCNELYCIENLAKFDDGGSVCNYCGEVIGIMYYDSYFLPINIVERWWKHYKSYGKFRRPWLGLKVDNLHAADFDFLQHFLKIFPEVSAGVVVLKIAEDSPAHCSKIHPNDVIVKCDDESVHSNLEFFEKIWDKVGKSVELTILRANDGSRLILSLTIAETSLDPFYVWPLPTSLPFKRRNLRTTAK